MRIKTFLIGLFYFFRHFLLTRTITQKFPNLLKPLLDPSTLNYFTRSNNKLVQYRSPLIILVVLVLIPCDLLFLYFLVLNFRVNIHLRNFVILAKSLFSSHSLLDFFKQFNLAVNFRALSVSLISAFFMLKSSLKIKKLKVKKCQILHY